MAYDKTIPVETNVLRGAGGDLEKIRDNFVELEPAGTSFALNGDLTLSGVLTMAGDVDLTGSLTVVSAATLSGDTTVVKGTIVNMIEDIELFRPTIGSGDVLVLDERAHYNYDITDIAVATSYSDRAGGIATFGYGRRRDYTMPPERYLNVWVFGIQGSTFANQVLPLRDGSITGVSYATLISGETIPGTTTIEGHLNGVSVGVIASITTSGVGEFHTARDHTDAGETPTVGKSEVSLAARINTLGFEGIVRDQMVAMEFTNAAGPGQIQLTISINGNPVTGLSGVTASGTQSLYTATSGITVLSGDRVTVELGSVSGTQPANLSLSLASRRQVIVPGPIEWDDRFVSPEVWTDEFPAAKTWRNRFNPR